MNDGGCFVLWRLCVSFFFRTPSRQAAKVDCVFMPQRGRKVGPRLVGVGLSEFQACRQLEKPSYLGSAPGGLLSALAPLRDPISCLVNASCWISKFIIPNSKFKPASRPCPAGHPPYGLLQGALYHLVLVLHFLHSLTS